MSQNFNPQTVYGVKQGQSWYVCEWSDIVYHVVEYRAEILRDGITFHPKHLFLYDRQQGKGRGLQGTGTVFGDIEVEQISIPRDADPAAKGLFRTRTEAVDRRLRELNGVIRSLKTMAESMKGQRNATFEAVAVDRGAENRKGRAGKYATGSKPMGGGHGTETGE